MPTIYLVCLSKTIINYSSSISITRRRQREESDPAVVYELRKNFTLSLEYSISIQHTYVYTYLALGLCFGSVLGTLSYSTLLQQQQLAGCLKRPLSLLLWQAWFIDRYLNTFLLLSTMIVSYGLHVRIVLAGMPAWLGWSSSRLDISTGSYCGA